MVIQRTKKLGEFQKVAMEYSKEMKQIHKVLFIVANTAQAEMFAPIAKELTDWNILFVNVNRWGSKKIAIEKKLQEIGFPWKTIESCSRNRVKQILEEKQPDTVVVGNDTNDIETLFIDLANSRNISTLLVQDGITWGSIGWKAMRYTYGFRFFITLPFRLFQFMTNKVLPRRQKFEFLIFQLKYGRRWKAPKIYGHGNCSKITLFGNAAKQQSISEGVNPESIIVTGSPKFDKCYYSKDACYKQKICERLGLRPEKDIVVLFTQHLVENRYWSVKQRREFVLAIVQATTMLPSVETIIKLHAPSENEEDYHKIVKGLEHPPIICQYEPTHELISACSLAITHSSTVALEAMAMGKPTVIVNLFDDVGPLFYKESGAIYVDKREDILPAIKKALYNQQTIDEMRKSMGRFVHEQAYLQDGQASRRIADLIIDMTSGRNTCKV